MRSHKGLHLQGGVDRTGDPILTNEVFHGSACHTRFTAEGHKDLALFVHDQLLKRTLLLVLPEILIQIPVRAFLSPVPVYCWSQSGTSWYLPGICRQGASTPAPSSRKVYWVLYILFFSLIINIVSVLSVFNVKFVSLSPFSSFFLPLVGGHILIERVSHSVAALL